MRNFVSSPYLATVAHSFCNSDEFDGGIFHDKSKQLYLLLIQKCANKRVKR